jgi:MraZ protein
LDAKSRVTVPARWRIEGVDQLLAVPDGVLPVLRLMPPQSLREVLENVEASESLSAQDKLAITRVYSARAFPCSLDKQRRLSLPANYVKALGLSREVMVVGAWKHIEVWRPEEWESYVARADGLLAVGSQSFAF